MSRKREHLEAEGLVIKYLTNLIDRHGFCSTEDIPGATGSFHLKRRDGSVFEITARIIKEADV